MLGDKLLPGTKPGFLKSEKMLGFKLLYIHKSVLENVYVNNIINYGWCYSITLTYNDLADVIAIWETLLQMIFLLFLADVICLLFLISLTDIFSQWYVADVLPLGLMLLPILVLFVLWLMLLPLIVADVVATYYNYIWIWQMSLPCLCVADVITTRLVLLPVIFILADVIAIIVANVMTTVLKVLADGIARWQMV